ncbi:MAG: OmpA family protein [Chitinophagaceae bacterium]|nr:OmpA family protein [Chitinophagaceae bacterium]MBL0130189.1 OmpA family protein [Chitinophagaceae bacterium]MBL0272243.1 OmpA family protein [Chitinophagaceae bacterium]
MKKILSALFALYLLIPSSYGQNDEIRPKALGISFFLNDFITPDRIRTTSLSKVLSDKKFAKMKEMSAGLAINYFKGLKPHVDIALSLGGSFVKYPMPGKSFINEKFLMEGTASLNLKMTTEKYWVQPYITLGVGGHKYGKYYGAFLPLGLGLKVNLFDEAHVFVTSTYRVPVTTETANYHLQHSIGFAGRLGKKKEPVKLIVPPPPPPLDTDGDGIIDELDKCPTVKGLAKYNGCPIPDTDKDGINDEEDKCPTVPGLARYQGCPIPDTDGDGINDEEDKCPKVPGVARYQGCPVPDTDGDGVNDEEDKCVTIPGPKENFGCPIIPEEVKKRVDMAARNILFITGSAKLQTKSYKGLNDVVQIMNDNPGMSLQIDGHTDNVGTDEKNQILSDNRAASVKTYLVSKGISESRITSAGHGETMPIADNKTAAGRQQNRRSEMTLSYYK